MPDYYNERERADLQEDTGSSLRSNHDLRELYYKGQTGLSGTMDRQETELIRAFLIAQTGAVGMRSIRDLWMLYLTAHGATYRPSLPDMLKEFFGPPGDTGGGNPSPSTGTPIGIFPLALTYA